MSVQLTSALASFWWLGVLAIFALIWCMFSMQGGRFVRNSILGRWMKSIRERYSADVLHKLAIAANAGRPLAGALSTLSCDQCVPDSLCKFTFLLQEDVWCMA